jgi:hypothetical protein
MLPLDINQVGLESEDENIPLCPGWCMHSIYYRLEHGNIAYITNQAHRIFAKK